MKYFETIIIGGGPAGSSAGISLLKKGKDCCIIDKHVFPREKTCGGLLSSKTFDLLLEMNLSIDPESFYINKTNKLQILNKKKSILTFDCKNTFYTTDRKLFDNLLITEYKKSGGVIFEGEKAIGIDFQEKIVITNKQQLKYQYLVCADGSKSISDKLIKKKKLGITVEADIPSEWIKFDNEVICLDLGLKINGYAWIFPKNGYATIGFGCPFEDGKNYLEDFKEYLSYCGVAKDVPIRFKGATLPFGVNNDDKAIHPEGGILLVGDAAGMVDSLTGEGIYFALKSGILAAQAIGENKNVLQTYQDSCKDIFEIVGKSYKIALIFYRYRNFFLLLAKNKGKRLARFIDNEVAYYNYGYNYNVKKKLLSMLYR